MARPAKEQMTAISSLMAARALTRAADPETRDQLIAALRSWLPETDALTLRELADGVAADFKVLANAVDARLLRMVDKGKAQLPGSVARISLEARSASG